VPANVNVPTAGKLLLLLISIIIIIIKCTYLSDTVTQNAAGALYTVNRRKQ